MNRTNPPRRSAPDPARRRFFREVARGSAIGAGALGSATVAFGAGAPKGGQTASTIVYLFLRGGIDGLNLVPPAPSSPFRADYEALRPRLQVPTSGDRPVLPVSNKWGFHPAAAPLRDLFQDDLLAVVHGTGLPQNELTRSHFDAQEMMELGTPGVLSTGTGWLARHLQTSPNVRGDEIIRALSSGSSRPTSLRGDFGTLTVDDVGSYHPRERSNMRSAYLAALESMYVGNAPLELAGASALETVQIVQELDLDTSLPGNVDYPNNSVGRDLENVGRLIAANLGLKAATVDFGGWDTHNNQGDNGGGGFFNQVEDLAEAIGAFWAHMKGVSMENDVVMVVHSDFGRRGRQNGDYNSGTDHGSGNIMLVLGGLVKGGKAYGTFRGLSNEQLFEGQDVAPEVDFRQVLGTVVRELLGNPYAGEVFPGFGENFSSMDFAERTYNPELLFANGFE